MAKIKQETPEAGSIESRTTVTLNSSHAESPDLYDVKVGGRRVAYIIDEAPYPVTPLPAETIKLKLTPDELRRVALFARGKIEEIVKERDEATSDLDRILAGG